VSRDGDLVDDCAAQLERRCREAGTWISGDGRIGEDAVAALLGLASGTLANKRLEGSAPPHYRLGGNGHRIPYGLRDVAAWIVAHRVEAAP
jgi:hypothetical protein